MKNKNLVLNKPTISQLRLYYEIVESIFSLDKIESRATRQENQKKQSEEGKKEGDSKADEEANQDDDKDTMANDNPFGDGPKLSSFKDLAQNHFDWINKILDTVKVFQSEAIKHHVEMLRNPESENKKTIVE